MIARNYCLMKLRDKHVIIPADGREDLPAEETDQKEIADKEKALSVLEDTIEELNPEQKTCVTLFYLEKKSYQDIVSITGYSLLQVKSYIQNGKRNLKLLVEKKLKQS